MVVEGRYINTWIQYNTLHWLVSSLTMKVREGPSIKYVTLDDEGVREGVTVCDKGRGSRLKSMSRHAYNFFYHTYETWNFKRYLTFCCNTCILTEGGTDKKHAGQNLPDKRQNPSAKSLANNWERIYTGCFCQGFCTRPTKNGRGSEMCDVLFGGSLDVWQSVTGGGGKICQI